MRVFRRRQSTTEPTIKSSRSRAPPKSHQHAPQRKPPDTIILYSFASSKRFVKKRVAITPFCFCLLALGPLGTVRSLGKTPTFEPATPTGHPGPAKPALLLGNDPKSFCKFFPNFLRSPVCGLLRKISRRFWHPSKTFEGNKPQRFNAPLKNLRMFWYPSKTRRRNKLHSFYLSAAVWAKPPTIMS